MALVVPWVLEAVKLEAEKAVWLWWREWRAALIFKPIGNQTVERLQCLGTLATCLKKFKGYFI